MPPKSDEEIKRFAYLEADYGQSEQRFQEFTINQTIKAVKGYKAEYCSCVQVAKTFTGFAQSVGAARNWPVNSDHPEVGGVVVLNESSAGTNTGHVATITHIFADTFTVTEGNYVRCQLTTREINKSYKNIIGYWINEN